MKLSNVANGFQAALLLGISVQELVVAQVGISTPFLVLTLLTSFSLCFTVRKSLQQPFTPIAVCALALASSLWCFLVLAVWVRDTTLLIRGRRPSVGADDPVVVQWDRKLFPSLCLWGCSSKSEVYSRWMDVSKSCRIGHILHGSLTALALVASLCTLVSSALEAARGSNREAIAVDPSVQLFSVLQADKV